MRIRNLNLNLHFRISEIYSDSSVLRHFPRLKSLRLQKYELYFYNPKLRLHPFLPARKKELHPKLKPFASNRSIKQITFLPRSHTRTHTHHPPASTFFFYFACSLHRRRYRRSVAIFFATSPLRPPPLHLERVK